MPIHQCDPRTCSLASSARPWGWRQPRSISLPYASFCVIVCRPVIHVSKAEIFGMINDIPTPRKIRRGIAKAPVSFHVIDHDADCVVCPWYQTPIKANGRSSCVYARPRHRREKIVVLPLALQKTGSLQNRIETPTRDAIDKQANEETLVQE